MSLGATTYYISPTGSNSYSCAQAQVVTTPKLTFASVFACMSAADTLILIDGTYTTATTGAIDHDLSAPSGVPPNGTSTVAMTTIQAQTDGLVTVNNRLKLGKTGVQLSYIKVQGIKFIGRTYLRYTHHIYLKKCGFYQDTSVDGNVLAVGGGPNGVAGIGTDNYSDLIEDCWIWGKGRILADSYLADKIVWRRMVLRHDLYTAGTAVGITAYTSTNISMQNIINVDNIAQPGSANNGDFAVAQHTAGAPYGNIEWLGAVSLNTEFQPWSVDPESGTIDTPYTHKLENCVVVDPAVRGGPNFQTWGTVQATNLTIKTQASTGSLYDAFRAVSPISGTLKNVLIFGTARYGSNSVIQPSYINLCTAGTCAWSAAYNQTTCATGCYTGDPLNDGTPASLKYPLRIEPGSPLKGAGDGGADIGANVVYRYGTDGTYWGEAGYNTLTANALWPWPNEDLIFNQMCTQTAETRGFCGVAGSQPLTGYIWNWFGNGNPYAGGSAPVVSLDPVAINPYPAQKVGTTSAAQTVTLYNVGDATLNITSIVASGDFARTTTCGATLAAGAHCTVDVTFSPTLAGTRSGALTFTDDAAGSPQIVSLSGIGFLEVVLSAGASISGGARIQ
jgi:hypothetical protein